MQGIPRTSWNTNFSFSVCNIATLIRILSQMNAAQAPILLTLILVIDQINAQILVL